ncbi:MAG: ABC transporter permease [Luteibacter sp.]
MTPAVAVGQTWRSLRRSPVPMMLRVFTLAIGVATFAAAFVLVDVLLLTPPPFAHHGEVVAYGENERGVSMPAASPMLQAAVGTPAGVHAVGMAQVVEPVNVRVGDRRGLVKAQRVDAGFLPTLGVVPTIGRAPLANDVAGIVVSAAFWHDWLDGDPSAVGRTIEVDGVPLAVRGVLPAAYRFQAAVDILLPLSPGPAATDHAANLVAIAWLDTSVPAARFSDTVRATVIRHAATLRVDPAHVDWYGATPLDTVLVRSARPTVLMFFTCGVLVLVIAVVNLSNLMLTHAVEREHESMLASAFGAFGWRARLPVVADVVLTASLACALGMPIAAFAVARLRAFIPESWLLSSTAIVCGWRAAGVAAVTALAAACMATAMGAIRDRPDRLLRMHLAVDDLRRAALARRARAGLVMVQVSLATVLVLLSVATAGRWWQVLRMPTGFNPAHAAYVEIVPDTTQFPDLRDVHRATDGIRSAIASQPGIEAAGVTTQLPVGAGFVMPFRRPDGVTVNLQYAMLSPGAVEALGLQLQAGRSFADGDTATSPAVAMVNQAYVDAIDPGGVGHDVLPASTLAPNHPRRIVGIVANTARNGAEHAAEPTVFLPFAQVDSRLYAYIRRYLHTYIVARGPGMGVAGTWPLHETVNGAGQGITSGPTRSLLVLARNATRVPRLAAGLIGPFALLAVALACIGLYSVQAIEVATRRRDIALRGALGASPVDLFGHVFARGMRMAMPGISCGLLAAVALQFWLESWTGTIRLDIGVAMTASMLMTAALLCAVVVPSLRAARTHPVFVLRGDMHSRRRPRIPRPH